MKRWFVLGYGGFAYLSFLVSALVLAGWLGHFGGSGSLDAAPRDHWGLALGIDLSLVLLFGLQHSLMARPGFKQWIHRWMPHPVERSTYVVSSSIALVLLCVLWRPMGGGVWNFQSATARILIYSLYALGWMAVVGSTFAINHFDLFGLRQSWLYFRGKPYQPLPFDTPGPYRWIRHPLYVGWIIVFWATPTMTLAHLLFATTMTAYILIAIPFEERDLVAFHGEPYAQYKRRVGRFLPRRHRQPAVSFALGKKERPVCDATTVE